MKTAQELIVARRVKQVESCHVPCLFCGSDEKYICKTLNSFPTHINVECKCEACSSQWTDIMTIDGVLDDISIPKLGTKWSPDDLK